MPRAVRPATVEDIPRLIDLLLLDAADRHARDRVLWNIADDASSRIEQALLAALTTDEQPFRQFWHVAEDAGQVAGMIHAMLLPVPPIYAGVHGDPGLILPDSFAAPEAPDGTIGALVAAAEGALRDAGAQIILSSLVSGDDWRIAFQDHGFEPLTLYFSRTGIEVTAVPPGVRPATEADVPGIVARSAENRQVLFEIDPFWAAHPDADTRFGNWMMRSLTLPDRDMRVIGTPQALDGYVIAQPASRLHFPPAHSIAGTGVIDDFYHTDLADPAKLAGSAEGARALLQAAETDFAKRGIGASFVICPADWRSKAEMLETAGYGVAMVWSLKRL